MFAYPNNCFQYANDTLQSLQSLPKQNFLFFYCLILCTYGKVMSQSRRGEWRDLTGNYLFRVKDAFMFKWLHTRTIQRQRHTLSTFFPHERKIKPKITNDVKRCSIYRKQVSPPMQALVSDRSTSAPGKQQHRQIDMLYVADVHQNGFHSPDHDPPSSHPKDLILHDLQSLSICFIGEIFHRTTQIVLIIASFSWWPACGDIASDVPVQVRLLWQYGHVGIVGKDTLIN